MSGGTGVDDGPESGQFTVEGVSGLVAAEAGEHAVGVVTFRETWAMEALEVGGVTSLVGGTGVVLSGSSSATLPGVRRAR